MGSSQSKQKANKDRAILEDIKRNIDNRDLCDHLIRNLSLDGFSYNLEKLHNIYDDDERYYEMMIYIYFLQSLNLETLHKYELCEPRDMRG